MNVQPLADLVMVEVDEARKTRGGLVLPKEISPEVEEGRAVSFGPDVAPETRQEIELAGGGVIYGALDHEANSYREGGRKYLFIRAKDLMGTLFLGGGDRMPRIQSALGSWTLMVWQEAKDTLLGGLLIRPVQGAKAHFTGVVKLAGPRADEVYRDGRYFFEQFSDFKWWTERDVRYAFVPQSAIYCEIPERTADVHLAPSEVASEEYAETMR